MFSEFIKREDEHMDRSDMKTICRKPSPRTIDAIRFGRKYLDPADLRLRCIDAASVGLAITGMAFLIIRLF